MLATKQMSVKVQFEYRRYSVQESCTMLPVTLVVMGEVIKPFTVRVIPIGFFIPSAQGMQQKFKSLMTATFYVTVCIILCSYACIKVMVKLNRAI